MNIEHVAAPLGEIHIPYNWTFANAAARDGAVITDATLVGRLARQLDDESLWLLKSITPNVWTKPNEVNVAVEDEGNPVTAALRILNFVGANVNASESGGVVTVTITPTDISGKQDHDTDLDAIAALAPSDDDLLQRKSGAWTKRTPAQVKVDLALNKSDVALGNVDNTADANKPVSTAQAAADAATLASATAYADGLVVGLWDDRGGYDASGNAFPSSGGSGAAGAVLKGDIWTITVAGALGGVPIAARQTVRALVDAPGQTAGNWAIGLANTDIDDAINAGVKGRAPSQDAVSIALAGKEPTQTAGTAAQYWRGDKSWSDFAADVRTVVLTGLSTASNAVITAADSVLSALGKLQKQVSDNTAAISGKEPTITGGSASQFWRGDKTWQTLDKSAVGLANVDNTSDANKPVSTAQAAANTTVLNSAKSYADGLVVGLWDDRGNYDASVNTFPASGGSGASGAVLKGDIWTISVAGTLGGVPIATRQTVRATVDAPGQTSTNWAIGLANTDIDDSITNGVTGRAPSQNAVYAGLAGKEPTIAAGTNAQYRRGDKTWQDFATDVRAAVLTGLSTATNAVITASDSVLSALGKLQKQVSDNGTTIASKYDKSGGTVSGNIGIIATASAWASFYHAVDIDTYSAVYGASTNNTGIANNAYFNGTNWIYKNTAAASNYQQSGGAHTWQTVASGAAGASLTFSTAMVLDSSGLTLNGTFTANGPSGSGVAAVFNSASASGSYTAYKNNGNNYAFIGTGAQLLSGGALQDLAIRAESSITFGIGGNEGMRLDNSRNLLVGVASASNHVIGKVVSTEAGNLVLNVSVPGVNSIARFYGVSSGGDNAANAAMKLSRDGTTLRSLNAGGTINASGADYAEYMTKTTGCGALTKGQIVGVDAHGQLTDQWTQAVSFLIKSTNPSYVGGDTWGSEDVLGMARPQEPQNIPHPYAGAAHPGEAPVAPPEPAEDASEDQELVYLQACDAFHHASEQYAASLSVYEVDQKDYADQLAAAKLVFDTVRYPAYQQALSAFELALEAARQQVDRIAFCGQVPVNVLGAQVGQYVVPVQDGDGIGAVLIDADAMTLQQYMKAVGVVQNLLQDGRANVRVKPV